MNKINYCGCGIYKIKNIVNDKFYFGSSVNVRRRISQHLLKLNKNKHENYLLQNAFKKYTIDSFEFELIEECEIGERRIREDVYLKSIVDWKMCYNISRSSLDNFDLHDHPDYENIVEKIRKARTGKYFGTQNLPIVISGISYSSVGNASNMLGIGHQAIKSRLNSDNVKYVNYQYIYKQKMNLLSEVDMVKRKASKLSKIHSGKINSKNKPFTIDGVKYDNIRDAERKLRISSSTIFRRLNQKYVKNKFTNYKYI
jgi:group I intron endonuclease